MIQVVGIGADGLASLAPQSRRVLETAKIVVGNDRQLELLDDSVTGIRRPLPSPMRPNLDAFLADLGNDDAVFLASGDPMVSGMGSTLIRKLGSENVRVHPNVSSAALARARMGWPWDDCVVITVVGNTLDRLRQYLAPNAKIVMLVARPNTPHVVEEFLVKEGYGSSRIWVMEDLGTDAERIYELSDEVSDDEVARLYLLTLHCFPDAGSAPLSLVPGLPDECYRSSQVTKRFVRAATIAQLGPFPGDLLWDLGAGSGSVAIEWCRQHPRNRAVAVEARADRAELIAANTASLGVAHLVQVRQGVSASVIGGLPDPDAVFIGGGADVQLIEDVWCRLKPGARLVANSVTIETDEVLAWAQRRFGGDLSRISVETAGKLGAATGFSPARSVTSWAVRKEIR